AAPGRGLGRAVAADPSPAADAARARRRRRGRSAWFRRTRAVRGRRAHAGHGDPRPRRAGRDGRRAAAARRARGDEDGDAARLALRGDRPRRPRERGGPGSRWRGARRAGGVGKALAREELLELHGRTHVALELELAGHVGTRRVLLARDDLLEDLLRSADRAVDAVLEAVVHADAAVRDFDRPPAGALDVEAVRVVHAGRLRRVGAGRKRLEELLHGAWHLSLLLGVERESMPLTTSRSDTIAPR